MRIDHILQVLNNTASEMNVGEHLPVLDTLNRCGDLAEKSEFPAGKANLLALKISHF